MTAHVNLTAYHGVEASANFADAGTLARYRSLALDKSVPQAAVIAERIGTGLDVLEVGCGNGRLGLALLQSGTARRYQGIDVSPTRIAFAREWARDAGIDGAATFEQADVLAWTAPRQFDAVVCITGAFGYFEAIHAGGAVDVLRALARACRPGGALVLELYNHPDLERRCVEAAAEVLREWSPLPAADPFEFNLHEFRFEGDRRLLHHGKVFIPRGGGAPDRRAEVLRLYRVDELAPLLADGGFTLQQRWNGWHGAPGERDETTLVIARPNGRQDATHG